MTDFEPDLDWLGEAERSLIKDVSHFIEAGVPNKDHIGFVTKFVTMNGAYQDRIGNFLLGLRGAENKTRTEMHKRETALRPDFIEDGFKASEERNVMMYKDAKYRDLKERLTKIQAVIERVEQQSWILKSLMKFVGG